MRETNWEVILPEAIEQLQNKEFAYGTFDCCIAASSLIEAITGIDLMSDLKARYTDETSADELIQSLGTDLSDAVSKIADEHGLESIPPLMASRGDLVVVSFNDQQIVGVVGTDPRYALCVTLKGMTHVPMSHALKAWRV